MNKLVLALSAALIAGSAMAADAPKSDAAPAVEKSAAAPKIASKALHHVLAHHQKAGKKVHHKHA